MKKEKDEKKRNEEEEKEIRGGINEGKKTQVKDQKQKENGLNGVSSHE